MSIEANSLKEGVEDLSCLGWSRTKRRRKFRIGCDIPRSQSVVRLALSREKETRPEGSGTARNKTSSERRVYKMDSSSFGKGCIGVWAPDGSRFSSCFVCVRLAGFEGCWNVIDDVKRGSQGALGNSARVLGNYGEGKETREKRSICSLSIS